jgi:hypothetical protein
MSNCNKGAIRRWTVARRDRGRDASSVYASSVQHGVGCQSDALNKALVLPSRSSTEVVSSNDSRMGELGVLSTSQHAVAMEPVSRLASIVYSWSPSSQTQDKSLRDRDFKAVGGMSQR